MRKPFNNEFPITQTFNDPRYRASYIKFGILGHNGIDYGLPTGTPVIAPHSGVILEMTNDTNGYGNYVKIENDLEGSVLGHLKSFSVNIGNTVSEGQEIGLSDNTGNSTGPHLHWGYYRKPRNRDNGFNGYIDQTDWMNIKPIELAITDQTKIPQLENQEVQAIRSKLNDLKDQVGQLNQAVDTAIKNRDSFWQPQVESAKKEIEELKSRIQLLTKSLTTETSYSVLIGLILEKLKIKKGSE